MFRAVISAIPFLLPLFFQLGFGWTAAQECARDFAVFDLGDPGLADPEHLSDLRLGQTGSLAHRGELVSAWSRGATSTTPRR